VGGHARRGLAALEQHPGADERAGHRERGELLGADQKLDGPGQRVDDRRAADDRAREGAAVDQLDLHAVADAHPRRLALGQMQGQLERRQIGDLVDHRGGPREVADVDLAGDHGPGEGGADRHRRRLRPRQASGGLGRLELVAARIDLFLGDRSGPVEPAQALEFGLDVARVEAVALGLERELAAVEAREYLLRFDHVADLDLEVLDDPRADRSDLRAAQGFERAGRSVVTFDGRGRERLELDGERLRSSAALATGPAALATFAAALAPFTA